MRTHFLICCFLFGRGLIANPQAPALVSGNASFENLSPQVLEIIASDHSVIEWKDFSIEAGETTRFIQPHEKASVLNRVMEAFPSRLLGNLEANGQVVLVNPNGILVGKEAVIDTGSLIASTLDIHEEFLFAGLSKESVVNQGAIRARNGDVLLIGYAVENEGRIDVENGLAGAIAAQQVVVKPSGTDRLYIRPLDLASLEEGGFSSAFLHDSSPDALQVDQGELKIVSIGGSMSSKNSDGTGGRAYVLGDSIWVKEGARIDVSNDLGAGEVLIGGDLQGKNENFANAKFVFFDKGAAINANSLSSGNGGKVILWSDRDCRAYGSILARGGFEGGDGGFVEISAKGMLSIEGVAIDPSSPLGKGGTILLDPSDVTIGGAPMNFTNTACPNADFTFTANTSTIDIPTLTGLLGVAGCTVNINTGTNNCPGACGGTGNITVSSAVNWATTASLSLTADKDIIVNASIQNSDSGDVTLTSTDGNIFINSAAGGVSVSVGSVAGTTTVTASGRTAPNACSCAVPPVCGACVDPLNPCCDCVLAALNPPFPIPTHCTCCNFCSLPAASMGTGNICMQGSTAGVQRNAQIGRAAASTLENCTGKISVSCNNLSLTSGTDESSAIIGHGGQISSKNSGDITVDAAGTILLFTQGPSQNTAPVIGHATSNTSRNQSGKIKVTAGQDIILTCSGNTVDACLIGHTDLRTDAGGFTVSGDIEVTAGRDLWIDSSRNGSIIRMGIGHSFRPAVGLTGNITVNVLTGNLNMIGSPTGGFVSTYIGLVNLGAGISITGDITVEVCGTINMDPRNTTQFGIGGVPSLTGALDGDVTVRAGADINIMPTLGGTGITTCIGYAPTGATSNTTTTTVTAKGNITINSTGGGSKSVGIGGNGNVNVSAGGNVVLNTTKGGNYYIGTDDTSGAALTTTIRSAGNITATNTGVGTALFGRNPANAAGPFSLDMRAAGDIQFASGYTVTGAATIFAEADTSLVAGQFGNFCGGASPPADLLPNNLGSVSVNKKTAATPALLFQTNTGKITIHSAQNNSAGALQNFLIGTGAANDMQIVTASGNIEVLGFNNITINNVNNPWTSGSILVGANNNLNATAVPIVTSGASALTLIGDLDLNGTGNLNISQNVSSAGGPILLLAGFGAAAGGTSAINQTGGTILSAGGTITAEAVSNITFSGAATSVNTGGGVLTVNSTNGTIVIDENILTGGGNANLTAGVNINVNPLSGTGTGGSVSTGAGNLSMNAKNNITINGDTPSLATTTGNMAIIADSDNSGVGNLTVQQNITSTAGGSICLVAGPGTFGCSQNNCHSGLISGFPLGSCTVNISGGTVSSTTGSITVTSAENIIVNGASPSISTAGPIALTAGLGDLTVDQQIVSSGSSITTFAGNDTTLTQPAALLPPLALISAAREIRMITGLNMTLNPNTAILSSLPGDEVTLIVDNIHPFQIAVPFSAAVSGSFTMLAGSSVTSGSPLRIFTAYSQVFGVGAGMNFIDPTALLNGVSPFTLGYPTAPFNNTPFEQWCVFFGCPANYPFPNLGVPFTFFYKICLQQLTNQANIIASQFLIDLHPFNEFPGWLEEFYLKFRGIVSTDLASSLNMLSDEPYYIRRRELKLFNLPKYHTIITNDSYLERKKDGDLRVGQN